MERARANLEPLEGKRERLMRPSCARLAAADRNSAEYSHTNRLRARFAWLQALSDAESFKLN